MVEYVVMLHVCVLQWKIRSLSIGSIRHSFAARKNRLTEVADATMTLTAFRGRGGPLCCRNSAVGTGVARRTIQP